VSSSRATTSRLQPAASATKIAARRPAASCHFTACQPQARASVCFLVDSTIRWRRYERPLRVEAVEKRVMRRGRRAEFLGRDGRDAGLSIGARGFERGDQLLTAAISGSTPMIAITRFML
jgi:hypothetical protein